MNASKTLTAIAAAAALVGSIGYASAQQGGDSMAPNAGSPADSTQMNTTPPATDTTTTAPSAVPADTTTTMVDSERAPQADRN